MMSCLGVCSLLGKGNKEQDTSDEFEKYLLLKDRIKCQESIEGIVKEIISFCYDTFLGVDIIITTWKNKTSVSFYYTSEGISPEKYREVVGDKWVSVANVLETFYDNEYHNHFFLNGKKYEFDIMKSDYCFSICFEARMNIEELSKENYEEFIY